MRNLGKAVCLAAAVLLVATSGFAEKGGQLAQGQTVITVLPAHPDQVNARISSANLQIKVDGKKASITAWTPVLGPAVPTELVLLIDGAARASLGEQITEIAGFVKEIPSNTKIAIAYMENGRAMFMSPFSTNPAQILAGLHLPGGMAGENASPYFCLSDLAKHWPAQDAAARRVVVMITDGVDEYDMRYDPDDPYVQAAVTDSLRAHLIVYSIYWHDAGRASRSGYETNAGQSLISEVTDATGGYSYWEGFGNPVTFQPYFQQIRSRLRHQYAISFTVPTSQKPGPARLQIKVDAPSTKVTVPHLVYLAPVSQ